jgi:polyisoprenyl-teichoic acid--peptidoglycan teichoic acid transferase
MAGTLVRARRLVVLAAVLVATAVVVPSAAVRQPAATLVKVGTARGIDHPENVVWVLCIGSDARPGQNPVRTRGDAIQLVGLNLKTGDAVDFGVPRDSWVSIPGVGSNRVNAALYYGGPRLMGQTVGDMFGVRPDYVFVTSFTGFRTMVRNIGGITVRSDMDFSDDNIPGHFRVGKNRLNGFEALAFGRMRHFLPRGDFDRSGHQQELLRAILKKVRAKQDKPGFLEHGIYSAINNLNTTLSPAELYRLAQAVTDVNPRRLKGCVLNGTIGDIGGASIVFPDLAQAKRLGADTRRDARLDHGC